MCQVGSTYCISKRHATHVITSVYKGIQVQMNRPLLMVTAAIWWEMMMRVYERARNVAVV